MSKEFVPKISAIIPMYNAEKYIGECLESIFAQTFQDFEIIVVDDCSTDKSCEIAKSYVKNFENKIKIIRRKFNSGLPSLPSNDGLRISKGKYVFFMDNDDLITKTAFEEIYRIAEDFSADVVCCEKYYQFYDKKNVSDSIIFSYQNKNFVTEPTLIEDTEEFVNDLLTKGVLWNLWTKLIRRDFLTDNKIKFVNSMGQDFLLTCCIFCSAKRIVRVPNVINFYRLVNDSLSNKQEDVQKILHEWIDALIKGTNYLDKFLRKQEKFKNRDDLKYAVFEAVAREFLQYLLPIYAEFPSYEIERNIRKEFEKVENKTYLMSFIFSRMNFLNVDLVRHRNFIHRLQQEIKS